MPQFPMIPERQKILARIPDYAVDISPTNQHVRVLAGGITLASTSSALLVSETRHRDVFYLPRADVDLSLFTPTELSTYCPFKGHANYWTLNVEGHEIENVVWSYEAPYPEVSALRDFLSFYTDKVDVLVEHP